MQVHELAARAAVAPHIVRYYARLGLLRPARDPRNKYKHFSQADLQRLAFIRKAKRLGFTLGEVRLVLEMSRKGKTPCPMVREVVRRRVADNAHDLAELTALQERMQIALRKWRRMPNGVPDGRAICRLIEAVGE
jgi:MerR family transcriptional regulator, Zn(II)-responsive regulator of zntA